MFKKTAVFLTVILLTTCGIEEYYYLPQVPEINITNTLNDHATIDIPPVSGTYPYAENYKIFYKIYLSGEPSGSLTSISNIGSQLVSDFNYFEQYTRQTNTSLIPSINTFRNRNYYELELESLPDINSLLSLSGGTFTISFPTQSADYPTASINGGTERQLKRAKNLNLQPSNDLSFRYSQELNGSLNVDVAAQAAAQYAYVSMYIILFGVNPENFTPLYSKPTHINIFKLP